MSQARTSSLTVVGFAFMLVCAIAALFFYAPRLEVSTGRPAVAATIFPLYDIVRNVAGDGVDVTLILPPGAEPHSFEPTPSTIREVSGSAATYAIGHGIDDWVDPVLAAGSSVKVTVNRGIALRESAETVALAESEEVEHGPTDPHYWLSVPNGIRIAETVADDLAHRFPANADAFHANVAAYRARLEALDADMRSALADLERREIVTFHDAWAYFAAEYGLRIVGTFEPAPGREPTPRALTLLRDTVRTHGVRTLYVEPLFSDMAIASFAADQKLRIAAIDDIGGAPGRDSYESLLRYNAYTIAENQ